MLGSLYRCKITAFISSHNKYCGVGFKFSRQWKVKMNQSDSQNDIEFDV